MKMKTLLTLIAVTFLTSSCSRAQPELFPTKPWTATLKIVDESGEPVAGASVEAGYIIMPTSATERWGFGERGGKIEGPTDANGLFTATHTDRSPSLGFQIQKSGYYKTYVNREIGFPEQNANNRKIEMTLILKKIGKPIPMYARKVQIEIPETNKSISFDLIEGDWVTPYGKGKQADFIFQVGRRWVSRKDFDCTMELNFSNRGDGLIPVSIPQNQGSELRMSAIAPSEGFVPEISKSLSHTPANGWRDSEREGNKEQNYYFRVRTTIDDRGNIVSAHYGKMYGDFALDPINSKTTWILFSYYFNPTPNDRNVEFDPAKNLIKNLKPLEEVKEP